MTQERPDYLDEREEAAIQRFLEDEVQMEAVKKVLLSGVYQDGRLEAGKPADPLRNFILGATTGPNDQLLPDEQLGGKLRAIINAVSLVESGFRALEKLKLTPSPVEPKPNKAR